jgi:hypothetical protein
MASEFLRAKIEAQNEVLLDVRRRHAETKQVGFLIGFSHWIIICTLPCSFITKIVKLWFRRHHRYSNNNGKMERLTVPSTVKPFTK